MLSDLRFPLFNSVMRASLPGDRVEAVIEARMAACRDCDVPMLWWTGPSSTPVDLGAASVFRHFLLRLDRAPASTSSLFLRGGVAGVYDVSTVPELRRRGLGAQITRAALGEARAGGCDMAILHSFNQGLSMYRQLGFEKVCDIGQYVWAPENFSR